jgi:hypothetical protein
MGKTNIFTYTLTNDSLVISQADNAVSISVLVKSGSIDFLGNLSFAGLASTSVTWSAGLGVTLQGTVANPLDGITITASSGADSAYLIISYS